jgi:hypothetical protein
MRTSLAALGFGLIRAVIAQVATVRFKSIHEIVNAS